MARSPYLVEYKNHTTLINRDFAKLRGIKGKRLKKINKLHKKRLKITHKMMQADPKKDKQLLRAYVQKLIKLDLKVQKAWGFDRSIEKLTWWRYVPHCTCSDANITRISPRCPSHGIF